MGVVVFMTTANENLSDVTQAESMFYSEGNVLQLLDLKSSGSKTKCKPYFCNSLLSVQFKRLNIEINDLIQFHVAMKK